MFLWIFLIESRLIRLMKTHNRTPLENIQIDPIKIKTKLNSFVWSISIWILLEQTLYFKVLDGIAIKNCMFSDKHNEWLINYDKTFFFICKFYNVLFGSWLKQNKNFFLNFSLKDVYLKLYATNMFSIFLINVLSMIKANYLILIWQWNDFASFSDPMKFSIATISHFQARDNLSYRISFPQIWNVNKN
jgi:hypothetical protein